LSEDSVKQVLREWSLPIMPQVHRREVDLLFDP